MHEKAEVVVVNDRSMLLSDFQAFSSGNDSEVRDLMERIYRHYWKRLDEKEVVRRKLQSRSMQRMEVIGNGA